MDFDKHMNKMCYCGKDLPSGCPKLAQKEALIRRKLEARNKSE